MDLLVFDDRLGHAVFDDGQFVATTHQSDNNQITPVLPGLFNDLWRIASAGVDDGKFIFTDLRQRVLRVPGLDLIQVLSGQWDRIIGELARSPQDLYRMSPLKFEELIGELLRRDGMEVQVTPWTRDGGQDIFALHNAPTGQYLYLVECKRWAHDRPVGVALVRSLYGVLEMKRATAGLLVTTSRLTKDALREIRPISHRWHQGISMTFALG